MNWIVLCMRILTYEIVGPLAPLITAAPTGMVKVDWCENPSGLNEGNHSP